MTSIILLKKIYLDVKEKQQGQLIMLSLSRLAFDDACLRDGRRREEEKQVHRKDLELYFFDRLIKRKEI
jgi:hypothetical protein